jgi:outer membrane protein TolC
LAKKLARVADDEVKALSAHSHDADRFFQQGLIPYNDLLRSEVALANAVQKRERARTAVQMVMGKLNVLLAEPVDRIVRLEDVEGVPQQTYVPGDLVDEALARRPAIRQLDLFDRRLAQEEKLAKSAWYPEIVLRGSYQRSGGDLGATYNDFSNDHNVVVALQANWTVFDWGKTRSEVDEVRSDRRANSHAIEEAENRVALQVRDAILELEVAEKNIATAEKALKQARENWRITKVQYDQQVTTSTEVLDARSFLSQADSNHIRAQYGYRAALALLDRAVGRQETAAIFREGSDPARSEDTDG